ncbi:hypothetical protein FHG87_003888 [Trinorchestia longiramus]|nr:hypothetical protein FHG87_003888 [Trinorchestia longiramus]
MQWKNDFSRDGRVLSTVLDSTLAQHRPCAWLVLGDASNVFFVGRLASHANVHHVYIHESIQQSRRLLLDFLELNGLNKRVTLLPKELSKIPSSQIKYEFDETVRLAMRYDIPFDKTIQNVVNLLQAHTSACVDTEKVKKLVFLTSRLELLLQKQFSMNDCFALQSYPKCNYEQLRDFLVLPCKRKLQYITSSIDKDQVLGETFGKVQTLQQKNVFLLVDEVQIRPTV